MRQPSAVAHRPTASEMRAPWTMRLKTSRPMKSAPRRGIPPGRASEAGASVAVGSKGAIVPASKAVDTLTAMISATVAPSGERRTKEGIVCIKSITKLDAGVEHHIEHVDEEVDHHDDERDEHD